MTGKQGWKKFPVMDQNGEKNLPGSLPLKDKKQAKIIEKIEGRRYLD